MSSVFFNKGENCIAAGRLFVEKSIHDEFVKRVLVEIGKMVSFSVATFVRIWFIFLSSRLSVIRWTVERSTDHRTTKLIWTS